MLNDISRICPLLKRYGILTVVDSVSAMFGEEIRADDFGTDILCGGSQKALSAPPGLAFVTISPDADAAMHGRKTPVASFYANLLTFDNWYENQWFPYTMPVSDIHGLRAALENVKNDPDFLNRHARIAEASRAAVTAAGLRLHQETGFSNTVTVFDVPEGVSAKDILNTVLREYRIMLAGSFDVLAGQVIRLGHMGENARPEKMAAVFHALDQVLPSLGVTLNAGMEEIFLRHLSQGAVKDA